MSRSSHGELLRPAVQRCVTRLEGNGSFRCVIRRHVEDTDADRLAYAGHQPPWQRRISDEIELFLNQRRLPVVDHEIRMIAKPSQVRSGIQRGLKGEPLVAQRHPATVKPYGAAVLHRQDDGARWKGAPDEFADVDVSPLPGFEGSEHALAYRITGHMPRHEDNDHCRCEATPRVNNASRERNNGCRNEYKKCCEARKQKSEIPPLVELEIREIT